METLQRDANREGMLWICGKILISDVDRFDIYLEIQPDGSERVTEPPLVLRTSKGREKTAREREREGEKRKGEEKREKVRRERVKEVRERKKEKERKREREDGTSVFCSSFSPVSSCDSAIISAIWSCLSLVMSCRWVWSSKDIAWTSAGRRRRYKPYESHECQIDREGERERESGRERGREV
jgi:hypothetical protein